MLASFANAYGSVIFKRAPLYPSGSSELLQASAESTGGEPISRNPLAHIKPLKLQWQGMSKANYLALETFFISSAKGMARTFTYTDAAGTAITVRFASPTLNFNETAHERYSGSVQLFKE